MIMVDSRMTMADESECWTLRIRPPKLRSPEDVPRREIVALAEVSGKSEGLRSSSGEKRRRGDGILPKGARGLGKGDILLGKGHHRRERRPIDILEWRRGVKLERNATVGIGRRITGD